MRFAVDAHAIGRHLTGNEVYIRSLLGGFAEVDRRSEFITYISEPGPSVDSRAIRQYGTSRRIPTRGSAGIWGG